MLSRSEACWLTILVIALLEPVSWITSQVPPCIVSANYYGPQNANSYECPTLHVFLIEIAPVVFEKLGDPNWVIAIATVVTASFTIVLGLFTISLARSTRVAADAAKRSADDLLDAERPHMVLSEINLSGAGMLANAQSGVRLSLKVRVTNHGRTPALLKAFSNYVVIGPQLDPAPQYGELTPIRFIIAPKEWYGTLGSHEIFVSQETARRISSGEEYIWNCILLQYEDAFHRLHTTRGSYRVEITGSSIRFYPDGPDSYWEYT